MIGYPIGLFHDENEPLDEFEEAQKYYDEKRSFIEKINMDDLVDEWFIQKRVLDRIELE